MIRVVMFLCAVGASTARHHHSRLAPTLSLSPSKSFSSSPNFNSARESNKPGFRSSSFSSYDVVQPEFFESPGVETFKVKPVSFSYASSFPSGSVFKIVSQDGARDRYFYIVPLEDEGVPGEFFSSASAASFDPVVFSSASKGENSPAPLAEREFPATSFASSFVVPEGAIPSPPAVNPAAAPYVPTEELVIPAPAPVYGLPGGFVVPAPAPVYGLPGGNHYKRFEPGL